MRDIQLYVRKDVDAPETLMERVELFGGDSITITDSIKNAKDPAKVFTTFSQQFTIPASKVNNKIFKHYYNYGIQNTFDARRKTDARIEINNAPFKTGKLSLDGVDLRNNKPYAYRVTFYGSIVDLKDVLREDKLPSLPALDIDKPYNASAIRSALTDADAADGTHIPLITVGQRLYYNSGVDSDQSGNLHYNASVNQGVKHDQLKYAIKITKIIEAIESKYSQITFDSQSFFKAGDKFMFNQLYMWCHRKKGEDTITAGEETIVPFVDQAEGDKFTTVSNNIITLTEGADDIDLDVTPSVSGPRYDLILYRKPSGESSFDVLQRINSVTGFQSLGFGIGPSNLQSGDQFKVGIRTYEEAITFTEIDIEFTQDLGGGSETTDDYILSDLNIPAGFVFNIASNLPDMKIIDFLSSLFKMFNLVAYFVGDKIQVKTLDEFYSSTERDVSKYVDIESSQVNVALPYKEITFKYKDTDTLVAKQHYQEIAEVDENGRGPFEWGAVEYTDTDSGTLSGGSYKIEPDFHHMKFERILDEYNGEDTSVQWGFFVDDNEETYLGSPLLFYSNVINITTTLSFLAPTGVQQLFGGGAFRFPSNFRLSDVSTSENLHFNPEINEFTREEGEETLFKQFYKNYIQNVFAKKTRLTKISCVLPAGVLIQINLSDVILLNGQKYRINSYTTNLRDGRTSFELLNYYA